MPRVVRARSRSRERPVSNNVEAMETAAPHPTKKSRKKRTPIFDTDATANAQAPSKPLTPDEMVVSFERNFNGRFGNIRGTTMFASYPVPASTAHPATNRSVAELASAYELSNLRSAVMCKPPKPGERLVRLDNLSPYQRFVDRTSNRAITMEILPDSIPKTAEELRDNPTGIVGLEAANVNQERQQATWNIIIDITCSILTTQIWDHDRTPEKITITGGRKQKKKKKAIGDGKQHPQSEASTEAVSTRVRGIAESNDHISTVQAVPIDQVPPPVVVERHTRPDGSTYVVVGRESETTWYKHLRKKTDEARRQGLPPEYVLANTFTRCLSVEQIREQMHCAYGKFRACSQGDCCWFMIYQVEYLAAGWKPPQLRERFGVPIAGPCIEYVAPEEYEAIRIASITGEDVQYRKEKPSMCIVCNFYVQHHVVARNMPGVRDPHELHAVLEALEEAKTKCVYDPVTGMPVVSTEPLPSILRPGVAVRTCNVVRVISDAGCGTFRKSAVLPAQRILQYGIYGDTLCFLKSLFVPEMRKVSVRNYDEIDERLANKQNVQGPRLEACDVDPSLVKDGYVLAFTFANEALFDKAAVSTPTSPFVFRPSDPSVLVGTHIVVPSLDELTVAVLTKTRHKIPHDVIRCVCRPVITFADDLRQELAAKYTLDADCPIGLLPSLKALLEEEAAEDARKKKEDEYANGNDKTFGLQTNAAEEEKKKKEEKEQQQKKQQNENTTTVPLFNECEKDAQDGNKKDSDSYSYSDDGEEKTGNVAKPMSEHSDDDADYIMELQNAIDEQHTQPHPQQPHDTSKPMQVPLADNDNDVCIMETLSAAAVLPPVKPLVPDMVMRFFVDPLVTPLLIASRTDRRWTHKHAVSIIKFLAELRTVGNVMEHCIMLAVLIKASLEEAIIKKMAVRNRAVTPNTRLMLFEAVANNYGNIAWFVERLVSGLPVNDRYICEVAHFATTGIVDSETGKLRISSIAEVEQLLVSPTVHVPRIALHLVEETNTISFSSDPADLSAMALDILGIVDYQTAVVLTMADFPKLVQMALQDMRIQAMAVDIATKYKRWDPRAAAQLVGITAAAAAVNEVTAQQVVLNAVHMGGQDVAPSLDQVIDELEVSIPAQMWRWSLLGPTACVVVLLIIARINLVEEAIARIGSRATLNGNGYNIQGRHDPLQADLEQRRQRTVHAHIPQDVDTSNSDNLAAKLSTYQVHGLVEFRSAHLQAATHLIDTVALFHRNEIVAHQQGRTDQERAESLARLRMQGGLDRVPLDDDVWCPRMHTVPRAGDIPDISNAIYASGIIGYGSGMYHPIRKKRGGAAPATRVVAEKRTACSVRDGDWRYARVMRRKPQPQQQQSEPGVPRARASIKLPRAKLEGRTASALYTTVPTFKDVLPVINSASTALWGDEGTGEEGLPWDYNAWSAWGGRGILTIVRLLRMLIVRPSNPRSVSTNYEAQTNALITFIQEIIINTADTCSRTLICTALLAGLGGLYRWSGAWPSFTRWLTVTAALRTSGACPKQLIDFVRRYPMVCVVCLRMALVYALGNDAALVQAVVVSGNVTELQGFAVTTVAAGHVLGVHMQQNTNLDAIEVALWDAMVNDDDAPLRPPGLPYLGMPEDECVRHIMAKAHKKRSDAYAQLGAALATRKQRESMTHHADPSRPPKLLNKGAIKAASQTMATRSTNMMYYAQSQEWKDAQLLISKTRAGMLPRSDILAHLVPLGGGYWDQSCLLTTSPWVRANIDPERLEQDVAMARYAYDMVVAASRRQTTLEAAENALVALPNRLYRSVYGLLHAYEMHASVRGTIISDANVVAMQRMAILGRGRGIMSRVPKQVSEQTISAATCVPPDIYGHLLAYMPEAFTCRRCCKVVATSLIGREQNKPSAAAHGTKDVGFDSTRGTSTCNCWWRHMKRAMAKCNANEGASDAKKQTVWSRSNNIYCGDSKTSGVPTVGYAWTLACSMRCYKANPMGGVTVVCSTCCGREILVDKCVFLAQGIVCELCVLPSRRRGEKRARHGALTIAATGIVGPTGVGMMRVGTGRREVGAAEMNAVGLIPVVGQADFDERACARCPLRGAWSESFSTCIGVSDGPNGTFKLVFYHFCKNHSSSVRMAAFGNSQYQLDSFLRMIVSREWLDSLSDAKLAYFRNMAQDEQNKTIAAVTHGNKRNRGHLLWVRWGHGQGGMPRDRMFDAMRRGTETIR